MSEQNAQMKELMLNTFSQLYSNLIQFINRLPINPTLKAHCFQNLDQGMYWCRTGIENAQLTSAPNATPELAEILKDAKVVDVPVENQPAA